MLSLHIVLALLQTISEHVIENRRASNPATENKENTSHHAPLRYTKSLNSSPNLEFKHGIPLGSLTAKLASKSFWGQDMLQQSMEKIAECAAKEVSCLGSSVESLSNSDEQFSDLDDDIITEKRVTAEIELESSGTAGEEEEERPRELRNPLSKLSTHSCKSDCDGIHTPPYLSPGITRRIKMKSNGFETRL